MEISISLAISYEEPLALIKDGTPPKYETACISAYIFALA